MSVVTFPFTDESPTTILHNVLIATTHPSVSHVVCVGRQRNETFGALEHLAASRNDLTVLLQRRIGSLRAGKGDAMNTALLHFLERTDAERLHFYDADITNFDATWIDRAETAANDGADVVRHSFPRASTDAMITWMVTRFGFALLWPETALPRIGQPLGGELLLTRPVAEALAADTRVLSRSDWGIDTIYTFATVQSGFSLYETFIPQGKEHRLYGSLMDLSTMLQECFSMIGALQGETVPTNTVHHVAEVVPAVGDITTGIGYSVDETIGLLALDWTDRQVELLERLPSTVTVGMQALREYPSVGFMDEDAWYETYRCLLSDYDPNDDDWRKLLFRLWATRVLNYTFGEALRGHSAATQYLEGMIERACARQGRRR